MIVRVVMALRLFLLLLLAGVGACNHLAGLLPKKIGHYDSRQVSVQTLGLFNQRRAIDPSDRLSWKGNWLFRRERLARIDEAFRQIRPEILVLQGLMSRQESPFEDDQALLSSGALSGYHWQRVHVDEHEDSGELESIAMATGLIVGDSEDKQPGPLLWRMDNSGYLAIFRVIIEGQGVMVVNPELEVDMARQGLWFRFISERIEGARLRFAVCKERVLVAGRFGGSEAQADYLALLRDHELKDTADGFCEQESDCYTDNSENPLFLKSRGDIRPGRSVRILSHKRAHVYSSGRNFDTSGSERVPGGGGLTKGPPVPFAGWLSVLRLPKCPVD